MEGDYPGAAVLIHIGGILGQPLADLWANPRLLDLVEQILGPEIAGHPVWNLRSKTPLNPMVTVPWHQDTAYLAPGAQNTLQPTAWIPLINAKAKNGTLQVLRGGHRTQNVFRHQLENSRGHKASWYLFIDEGDLPAGEVVTCEMEFGSFLLLNQLVPHRSTENLSDKIRWSVDLRWQRPDEVSGFEGIKDPIMMRSARQANFQLEWREWAMQNRIAAAMDEKKDEFDASVMGPGSNAGPKRRIEQIKCPPETRREARGNVATAANVQASSLSGASGTRRSTKSRCSHASTTSSRWLKASSASTMRPCVGRLCGRGSRIAGRGYGCGREWCRR